MVSNVQQPDNEKLYQLIQSRTGLILNIHQRSDVAYMLGKLVASLGAEQPDELLSLLSGYPLTHALWQRIIHLATVGETYFFRNQAQFDALRSHILPSLIEERRIKGSKHLRIWSAGSATGEEPYSLAILLREMLPDIESWRITLLATDLNQDYLDVASRGIYRARSFRNETPDGLQARWFIEEPDGYRLISAVRDMVMFRPLNLVSDDYPAAENNTMVMDIIFCRNVTIYFDRESTRRIAQRFHQTLNPGGWLVVGHSEPQADLYMGFTPRNFKDTVLYQKASSETPRVQPAASVQISPVVVPPSLKPKAPKRKTVASMPVAESALLPATVGDFWTLAKAAADLEQWNMAREWLNKAEQTDALQPQIHYLRALVELHTGNTEECLRLLRQAVYCDANFAVAHYVLGNLYFQQGSRRQAVRHWQLAYNAIEDQDGQQMVPYGDDLTVEMLVDLLAYLLTKF